ncbi:hypothetical protein P5705_02200 [Pseudomonas entomophila]|uniref:HET-C-related protein n=1 Tax=Pseudomonas entomophila TaxID=312306 RepID=UPI002404F3D7|nr:HET-C-related protein [Pseudomonas entomophila]MDF9616445.1 hypothetical protein [Pseudomonas entomophila]
MSELNSTFALDQLTGIARTTGELEFVLMFMPIFGYEVPAALFTKFRDALLSGEVENPEHRVDANAERIASYDSDTRTISVDISAIEQALEDQTTAPHLLIAMLGAFGRHLHALFASELDAQEPMPELLEAEEVGHNYAAMLALFDSNTETGTVFGYYTNAEETSPLLLDFSAAPDLEDLLPQEPGSLVIQPRFGAGTGNGSEHSFAHESIEHILKDAGFSERECKAIYFGNWLRDHSQIVDPKIVRPAGASQDQPWQLPREILAQIIDIFAHEEFISLQETDEDREAYRVTKEMLGVYRPSEHIDNPTNLDEAAVDPRTIDEDFEALVRPGDPKTQVNPYTSKKHHIDYAESYMRHKLFEAATQGKTPAGMRCFGEALHVLEDYFAHSNFVELSLIKQGHEVLPWTTPNDKYRHGLPVVTGLFSSLDVIASVIEPLGKILFSTQDPKDKRQPGYRARTDKALLLVLSELEDRRWYYALNTLLAIRDGIRSNPLVRFCSRLLWAIGKPDRLVSQIMNAYLQKALVLIGELVHDHQTALGDPNTEPGVDPTHTQLAKDHDDHPFHALAARLAQRAVYEVGLKMRAIWDKDETESIDWIELQELASSFLLHPNDSEWQDDIVAAWSATNAQAIEDGKSASYFERHRKQEMEQSSQKVKALSENPNFQLIKLNESFRNTFPLF